MILVVYHFDYVSKIKSEDFKKYEKLFQAKKVKQTQKYTTSSTEIETTTAAVNYLDTCEKTEKIVFLKTHKTGSETMAGIFRKYALMNNVSTMLSSHIGGHLYGHGKLHNMYHYSPLTKYLVPILGIDYPGAHYELLANHMTYNKKFIDQWFDPTKTKKLTILRNPVTLLLSSWKYYYSTFKHPRWPKSKSTQEQAQQLYDLLSNPLEFFDEVKRMDKAQYRHILRTQVSSFGYDKVYDRDLSKELVNKWIQEIAKEFDLIMIMEYFDLSLALMAIELCWPLEFVANLKMNEGKHFEVDKQAYHEELIRLINYPDFMLYEHFNTTFWNKVNEVGRSRVEEMAKEIATLSKELERDCVESYRVVQAWNKKMISEPVIRKEKADDMNCVGSIRWGNDQSELLKERQWDLIKREKWVEQ